MFSVSEESCGLQCGFHSTGLPADLDAVLEQMHHEEEPLTEADLIELEETVRQWEQRHAA